MQLYNRSVVFAYSEIGCVCLEAILSMGAEVLAVFTHEDDPHEEIWFRSVARVARDHGIPVFTDPPGRRLAYLRELNPDLIFSFYYRRIIPDEILKRAPGGAYNLHGSLLPRYRGRAPVNWAVIMGERESGVTLHHMTEEADRGDIVDQEIVAIGFDDTARDLYAGMAVAARAVMLRNYPLIVSGVAPRRPQDDSLATTFRRRSPSDGIIDWERSANEIYNLVRGTTHPFPGAFSYLVGGDGVWRKTYIWRARPLPLNSSRGRAPGAILSLVPLCAATGDGVLQIERIQVEEQPELAAANFVNLYNITPGMAFDSLDALEALAARCGGGENGC